MDSEYEIAYGTLSAYVELEDVGWDAEPADLFACLSSTASFLVNDSGFDEDVVVQAIHDVCDDNGISADDLQSTGGAQY